MLRNFRKVLGRQRDKILYGRRNERLRLAALEASEKAWTLAGQLAPLPGPAAARCELHMMTGEPQALMGIWSSYSLLRFSPDTRLVIHSDGTLTDATIQTWITKIPGARVVTRDESIAITDQRLDLFPNVKWWSGAYHFGLKLGGYYGSAQTPRLIEADTDTLTFRAPRELLDNIAKSGPHMAWNRDEKSCYAYDPSLLSEIWDGVALRLPERLNAGYMASYRFEDDDWALLDELIARLRADPRTDALRYWTHQTLVAGLASTLESRAGGLPTAYDVHRGPTRKDAIMRHYVGNPGIRPRFFTEGIPMVVRSAAEEGQLPAKSVHLFSARAHEAESAMGPWR